jgi:hypothetical protein
MSATPDSTFTREQLIADLRRQLAECQAERDECQAEREEALQRETATAEVLQVINSSPGDLTPVFDAMLGAAMRLCGAAFGEIAIIEGGQPRTVVTRGVPAAFAEFRSRYRASPLPGSITARLFAGEPVIHTIDAADSDLYREGEPHRRAMALAS